MLQFDGNWRFDSPGAIEPAVQEGFRDLINRINRSRLRAYSLSPISIPNSSVRAFRSAAVGNPASSAALAFVNSLASGAMVGMPTSHPFLVSQNVSFLGVV